MKIEEVIHGGAVGIIHAGIAERRHRTEICPCSHSRGSADWWTIVIYKYVADGASPSADWYCFAMAFGLSDTVRR